MSQSTATLAVVNASSSSISGTVYHWSGEGGDHIATPTPPLSINLNSFGDSATGVITARSDHDDYWFWQPANYSGSFKVQQNLDGSAGAYIVITDDLMVVVTSKNGIGKTSLPQQMSARS